MLIKSPNGNSVIRTEELAAIYHLQNSETNRPSKTIMLQFKSGKEASLCCRNTKEAKELFDFISNIMEKDYELLFK